MNDLSIKELEAGLHGGEREVLDSTTLAEIRRRGGRRRAARRALTSVGAVVLVGIAGLTLALSGTLGQRSGDAPMVAKEPTPTELGPLAKRALAEIPGAVQVSKWQVVVPSPDPKSAYWMGGDIPGQEVVGDTVPLDAKSYQGVTMYPAKAWPAWLYEGTQDYERSQGTEDSYPVGSTGTGILVEVGDAELACVSGKGAPCAPALMTRTSDGKLHHEWGMGTEEFLTPGSDMEVFLTDDYSTGSAGTLAIAGLPGTDVARVDFVATSGEVVAGQVSTTLVEGASMMWARVPPDLAKVIAYDADGEVIEDHPLRDCDDPVDCEVR
jgi:hypothetical protein